jgi:hypothetical protein
VVTRMFSRRLGLVLGMDMLSLSCQRDHISAASPRARGPYR